MSHAPDGVRLFRATIVQTAIQMGRNTLMQTGLPACGKCFRRYGQDSVFALLDDVITRAVRPCSLARAILSGPISKQRLQLGIQDDPITFDIARARGAATLVATCP